MAASRDDIRHLLNIPSELLGLVSIDSNWRDILRLTELSQQAYQVFSSNEVWQPLCEKYFPHTIGRDSAVTSYKAEFQRLYHQAVLDVSRRPGTLTRQYSALQQDRHFILAVLSRNGAAICHVSDAFKNDIEMANAAIVSIS